MINFQGMILTIKIPRASFQRTKTKLRQRLIDCDVIVMDLSRDKIPRNILRTSSSKVIRSLGGNGPAGSKDDLSGIFRT